MNSTKNILDKYYQHYRDTVKVSARSLVGGSQTVKLYKLNDKSMFNRNMDTYYENVGDESPIRFSLIKDYKIYNLQTGSYSLDWSVEIGARPEELTLEFTCFSNTVIPSYGDFISFEDNEKYNSLFKVSNIVEDSLDSSLFVRITVKSTKYRESDILGQITSIAKYSQSTDKVISETVFDSLMNYYNETSSYFNNEFTANNLNTRGAILPKSSSGDILYSLAFLINSYYEYRIFSHVRVGQTNSTVLSIYEENYIDDIHGRENLLIDLMKFNDGLITENELFTLHPELNNIQVASPLDLLHYKVSEPYYIEHLPIAFLKYYKDNLKDKNIDEVETSFITNFYTLKASYDFTYLVELDRKLIFYLNLLTLLDEFLKIKIDFDRYLNRYKFDIY